MTRRLIEVGLDPTDFGDPGVAWSRLHARYGRRVTLIDRYALEAANRGLQPEVLDREERARLTREVLTAQYPGLEVVKSAGRTIGDPIEIVPYQATWPRSFAAWRERLYRALSAAAVRIEHVGSTAVPGLAAKPVIDVQVSVNNLDDESSYVRAIERLEVSLRHREPEHRYFRPAAGRPRTAQIHVCAAASEWEREHLLFRDYLRANAEARAAYALLKRDLAERYRDDRLAYNEGKTGFILDALDAARAWAERSSWALPPPVSPGT